MLIYNKQWVIYVFAHLSNIILETVTSKLTIQPEENALPAAPARTQPSNNRSGIESSFNRLLAWWQFHECMSILIVLHTS